MHHQHAPSTDNSENPPFQESQNLKRYFNEIGRYKVLSSAESMDLAIRYAKFKDPEAARQLILTNLRLVVKIALKYHTYRQVNFMDLVQEGNAGLVRAIKKFDPSRRVHFTTYAAYWIRSHILRFVMDNSRLVKVSTTQTMRRMYFNYNKEKNKLEMQTGRADSETLAEILQISREELAEVQKRLKGAEVSLTAPISHHDSEGSVQDLIAHPGPSMTDAIELRDLRSRVRHILAKEEKKLTSREMLILSERLMTDTPLTLKVIGERLNVSRERARQLEANLLEKLRKTFHRELNGEAVYFHGAS